MERKAVTRVKKGCKRCGSTDVAWHQSERGKWYLIEVFTDPRDGGSVASYRDFHSTYCGKPELHNAEQEQITTVFQMDEADRQAEQERRDRKAEDERIEHEAAMMKAFMNLTPDGRIDFMRALDKKKERHTENWVSMDYMTEHMKWVAEGEALDAEMAFYVDLLADLEDED